MDVQIVHLVAQTTVLEHAETHVEAALRLVQVVRDYALVALAIALIHVQDIVIPDVKIIVTAGANQIVILDVEGNVLHVQDVQESVQLLVRADALDNV